MVDVYCCRIAAFTQIYAITTPTKKAGQAPRASHSGFSLSHEEDADVSPRWIPTLQLAENEVMRGGRLCESIQTDLATMLTKYRMIEVNADILARDRAMVADLRDEALQNLMTYQDSMKRSYDKKLRARAFKPGDWVLRTRQRSNEEPNSGKLGSSKQKRNTPQYIPPVVVLKGNLGAIRSIRFSSDGKFMAVAEPADFVHIYNTTLDYKRRQEIDFFGEISGISLSPDDESLFVGVWDRTYASLLHYGKRHEYSYLESSL
ncbi:hypothetical protein IFM89_033224 [Coptis chinensis]|uniref:Uncharacterized protein n=1 Tax=Coptis chinensis TaxID=261450 RepID=A0A835IWF1_9MAGN|nr:hypothetical protein IFM89_033224 [Coptis chinensis]